MAAVVPLLLEALAPLEADLRGGLGEARARRSRTPGP